MAIDKSILNQYISEKQEILELRVKIERLESKISKIEQRIAEIEEGHTVKDKVRGGEGGLQSFVIEGVPYDEYNDKLSDLAFAKKSLYHTKEVIKAEEMRFILRTKEVPRPTTMGSISAAACRPNGRAMWIRWRITTGSSPSAS